MDGTANKTYEQFKEEMPPDLRKKVQQFMKKRLGYTKQDGDKIDKFLRKFYDIYMSPKAQRYEEATARWRWSYAQLMRPYGTSSSGTRTRMRPYFVHSIRQTKKGPVVEINGVFQNAQEEGAKPIYSKATVWGDSAEVAVSKLQHGREYMTELVFRYDDVQDETTLSSPMGKVIEFEECEDEQLPGMEQFMERLEQDGRAVDNLELLFHVDEAKAAGLYSNVLQTPDGNRYPDTDIRIIKDVTIIDTPRVVEKGGRKLGVMNVTSDELLLETSKNVLIWADPNHITQGEGAVVHVAGILNASGEPGDPQPTMSLHFMEPVIPVDLHEDEDETPEDEGGMQEEIPDEELFEEEETPEEEEEVDVDVDEGEFGEEDFF